jgi:glucose/arabinose dehydrogenase
MTLVAVYGVLFATPADAAIRTVRIVSGLVRPVFVTSPPGDDRLFIVEQRSGSNGRVRVFQDGALQSTPFLTVSGVTTGSEQGLLGLAFHPDYAANRKFYVNYTTTGGGAAGKTVVAEYLASAGDPDVADAGSARTLLEINQPQTNHNAGWMAFGPDGYLYISSGDGGGGGDTGTGHTSGTGNAQDITDNLLGKILRIDVNSDDFPADPNRNYAIPATNPFVGVTGDDEIWAYGLRNPWRNSFDRDTGDLMIADVGQNAWEEVNYQPASSTGGENYGWRLKEATHCYNPSTGCDPGGLTDPIYEYAHSDNTNNAFSCGDPPPTGCSITGGYVYRGSIGSIAGRYFLADYCSDRIMSFEIVGGAATDCQEHTAEFAPGGGLAIDSISSFGEDDAGELYICDLNGGEVFKIVGDSDGDGVPDFLDLCPDTIPGATVDNDGCPDPPIPADFDNDGDVDQGDVGAFIDCASGATLSLMPGCEYADLDNDEDGDQSDFGIVQRCLSGEDVPGDPNCAG